MKFDGGKLRYDLIPFEALEQIVAVLTYGAEKYEPENWKTVEVERYMAAAYRHMAAVSMGEELDADTGLPHLAHAGCCILFMLWMMGGKLPKGFDFSAVSKQFEEERAENQVFEKCTVCGGVGAVLDKQVTSGKSPCPGCLGTGRV